jgi:4-hydroxybenzoate polyprenyltransferase
MNPFEKTIKARTGMVIYWAVNGTGILAGAFIAFRFRSILLGLVFPCIAILLWIYSSKYKQMLLVGNLVVAFLSSLVLLIVWYFEFLHLRLSPDTFAEVVPDMKLINWYFTAYSLFAFLVTFIREVIKDLEDVEGDRHVGCMTLPVVSGIKTSVRITAALIIITFLILSYAMVIFLNRDEILVFWYLAAAVQVPLLYLLVKLFLARTKSEFHFLSNLCKIIMVAGLLSIQLI